MRTSLDVLRSMHRYAWRAFEDDAPPPFRGESRSWEIRYWGTEGEFRFPFARVAAITPVSYAGPAVVRDASQTFAVHAYPVPLDDPEASILEAERVVELLTVAFDVGFSYVDKPNPADASTWVTVAGAPHRVPLYDYAAVPLDGPASVSYARGVSDYVRVLSSSVNRIVDPEDDRYWLVVAELRATWRRLGRVPHEGPIVQDVVLSQEVS